MNRELTDDYVVSTKFAHDNFARSFSLQRVLFVTGSGSGSTCSGSTHLIPHVLAVTQRVLTVSVIHTHRESSGGGVRVFTEPIPLSSTSPRSTWPGGSDTPTVALLENKLRRRLRLPGPIDALQGVALLGGIDGWPIAIIITLPPSYRSPTE